MIDFRSDTVTKPTPAMLQAMQQAEVGHDVFGDDLTILALESKAAKMFGKEAALFCASGTMTNQIAIKVHTQPSNEVICAEDSHIYKYEGGGMAFNSGVQAKVLKADRGRLNANQVLQAINADDIHFPKTSLVSLENTHNRGGGSVYTLSDIKAIKQVCEQHHLPLHLDGARIFNALVTSGISAAVMGQQFDSISVCLSKGLGCPVGSLLLGTSVFIKQAKRVRKILGGGWRQAGYLAAAGIYALEHHIERLADDHLKAKEIEKQLQTLAWVENILPVETNIVIFNIAAKHNADEVLTHLLSHQIKASKTGPQSIRFVTHIQTTEEDIQLLCKTLENF
ncbi:MAG: GntG family PLP-dependent aldolase [Bacteroidota bacterium]